MKDTIAVSGIMLRRSGDYAIVEVEIDGVWREIIMEPLDAPFSHIVEPAGMRNGHHLLIDKRADGVC